MKEENLIDPVGYFVFLDGCGLLKEADMCLSKSVSRQLKDGKEEGCFFNASVLADKNLSYVEGFVLVGSFDKNIQFYEHAWNIMPYRNVVIDVTLSDLSLHRICEKGNFYIEVARYSEKDVMKNIYKTDGNTPFFMYFDDHKKKFDRAREAISASFPQASYEGESCFCNKQIKA